MAREMVERELTQSEQKEIMKLDLRRVRMGGKEMNGYFDRENDTFYEADSKGIPTGTMVTNVMNGGSNTTSSPGNSVKGSKATSKKSKPKEKENSEAEPEKKTTSDDEKKKLDTKKIVGIAVFAIFCVGVVLFSLKDVIGSFGGSSSGNVASSDPTPTAQTETYSVTNDLSTISSDTDEESADSIYILQAVRDIYMGETFDDTMIQVVSISVADYNTLIASGITPCKYEDVDSVIGLYATAYIQAYQYISFTDVSSSNPITGNPWGSFGDGYAVVTIPAGSIDAENGSIVLGAKGTLTIVKSQTIEESAENNSDSGETSEDSGEGEFTGGESTETQEPVVIEGLTVEEGTSQSYVVNTYTIENAVIADILNANGESTYSYLAQYISLPQVRMLTTITALCADSEFIDAVTPSYIVLLITSDQSNAIGDISDSEITLTLTGGADTETTEKSTTYEGLVEIFDIINSYEPEETEDTEAESEADTDEPNSESESTDDTESTDGESTDSETTEGTN